MPAPPWPAPSRLVHDGADLVDVGGESTRPGAGPVEAAEEWSRIGPVVEALALRGIPVSVDTMKAEVARRAADAGAVALNDVSGLRFDPGLADVAAGAGMGLIMMHMRGMPRTMQRDVTYDDLLGEVKSDLQRAIGVARERGCLPEQLVVDPGIGFGKSAVGNLELIAGIGRLLDLGCPVLVGPSRKSFIGEILDLPPGGAHRGNDRGVPGCAGARGPPVPGSRRAGGPPGPGPRVGHPDHRYLSTVS